MTVELTHNGATSTIWSTRNPGEHPLFTMLKSIPQFTPRYGKTRITFSY